MNDFEIRYNLIDLTTNQIVNSPGFRYTEGVSKATMDRCLLGTEFHVWVPVLRLIKSTHKTSPFFSTEVILEND